MMQEKKRKMKVSRVSKKSKEGRGGVRVSGGRERRGGG